MEVRKVGPFVEIQSSAQRGKVGASVVANAGQSDMRAIGSGFPGDAERCEDCVRR